MAQLILRNRTWHGAWYVNGVPVRKSLQTDNRKVAEKRLDALVRKSARGWNPEDDRVTFDDLIEKVRSRRERDNRRCHDLDQRAAHLKPFFGGMRAVDVSTDHIEQYVAGRRREHAAPATINQELAVLRRGFNLAELARKPRIELLELNNARTDFLDWPDFQAVREHLPEWARDFISFAYLSAWRQSQIAALEWRDIDMREHIATARGETTKNGEPHRTPLIGELSAIVQRAHAARRLDCPFVFHRDGEPFRLRGSKSPLRRAWAAACEAAGFKGHVLHCLRRSAVRNMLNSGVDPITAMQQGGWKSLAIMARYHIKDLKNQRRALEKTMGFLETQPATSKVSALVPTQNPHKTPSAAAFAPKTSTESKGSLSSDG